MNNVSYYFLDLFTHSPGEFLSAVRAHNKAKKAMDHHNIRDQ